MSTTEESTSFANLSRKEKIALLHKGEGEYYYDTMTQEGKDYLFEQLRAIAPFGEKVSASTCESTEAEERRNFVLRMMKSPPVARTPTQGLLLCGAPSQGGDEVTNVGVRPVMGIGSRHFAATRADHLPWKTFFKHHTDFALGDIILLEGNAATSVDLELSMWSMYSHAAIVIDTVKNDKAELVDLIICEATGNASEYVDIIDGKVHPCVVRHALSDLINHHFYDSIGIRRMTPKYRQLLMDNLEKREADMNQVFADARPYPYPFKTPEQMAMCINVIHNPAGNAVYTWEHQVKELKWGIICSQLVSEVLFRWGLLPQGEKTITRPYSNAEPWLLSTSSQVGPMVLSCDYGVLDPAIYEPEVYALTTPKDL